MVGLLTASLANSTWQKHGSALKCFKNFEVFSQKKFDWPLSKECVRGFVSWAVQTSKLKPSTVQSYISSLSYMHKVNDLDNKNCSDFVVKSLIKGAENLNFYRKISENTRKVMTLPLLKILGHQIAASDWSEDSKQVFWTALTVAFFGSFRFGEILCSSTTSFIEDESLLWKDVILKEDSVLIKIKIPKSRNAKGEFVDLFRIPNCTFCPVLALRKLHAIRSRNPQKPVFEFASGSLLTSGSLNSCLVKLLRPIIGESATSISGHSFRAALPSVLANRPDLASDEDIKRWGRWSSASFQLYTRLKPQQRRIIFSKIVAAIHSL